jgi:para-nitrobenzyl esterase
MRPFRGLILICILACVLPAVSCAAPDAAAVRVTVESGPLSGMSDGTVETFKGVPYAAPPIGGLRWRPPQPAAAWTGARDATGFGAACMQASAPEMIDGAPGRLSEDCLTLNIWAPAQTHQPNPVMVWLHGGGNTSGAGSKRYYDGTAFARDGVVLVTINYRLGVFGFFAHPAVAPAHAKETPQEPGNFGLMDQIAALAWVRKNIHAFGGDPANVTLFGESAGGQDAMALMSSPLAAGLFQKAIVESAGWWMHLPSRAEAEKQSIQIAAKLDLPATVSADQLRAVAPDTLVKIVSEAPGPFVDGHVLPMQPETAFAKGSAAHVPFIIGWNTDEASLIDGSDMKPASILGFLDSGELAAARALYGTGSDDGALARAVFRDANFAAPARWAAEQASRQTNVYLYRFSYVRQRQIGRLPGASHGSEIPYVFDSWRQSPGGGRFLADADRAEAAMLHACWVSFARQGSPVCPGALVWPAYRRPDDEQLDFGSAAVIRRALDARQLDFLEAHILRQAGLQ